MLKKVIFLVALFLAAICFSGCQMVEGLGKDIQWTGESIQKTAD